MFHRSLRTFSMVAALCVLATPAFAGPPWISAEFPANPHDASTRGAFFLVHTYHHGTPTQFPLTGTAEGLVNGRRQTMRLEIVATSKPGVYAVRFKPQAGGTWVLALNMGERDGAGILVAVGKDGRPMSANVPTSTAEGGRWIIPRTVNSQDIESALRSQTALNSDAPADEGSSSIPASALVALGLVLGIPLAKRIRQ